MSAARMPTPPEIVALNPAKRGERTRKVKDDARSRPVPGGRSSPG